MTTCSVASFSCMASQYVLPSGIGHSIGIFGPCAFCYILGCVQGPKMQRRSGRPVSVCVGWRTLP